VVADLLAPLKLLSQSLRARQRCNHCALVHGVCVIADDTMPQLAATNRNFDHSTATMLDSRCLSAPDSGLCLTHACLVLWNQVVVAAEEGLFGPQAQNMARTGGLNVAMERVAATVGADAVRGAFDKV
jgi:hypothetical protein